MSSDRHAINAVAHMAVADAYRLDESKPQPTAENARAPGGQCSDQQHRRRQHARVRDRSAEDERTHLPRNENEQNGEPRKDKRIEPFSAIRHGLGDRRSRHAMLTGDRRVERRLALLPD